MKKTIIISLALVACCIGFSISRQQQAWLLRQQLEAAQDYVPSVAELQARLNNQGYYCEVDSRLGPETKKQWGLYIGDRTAEKLAGHYYEDKQ